MPACTTFRPWILHGERATTLKPCSRQVSCGEQVGVREVPRCDDLMSHPFFDMLSSIITFSTFTNHGAKSRPEVSSTFGTNLSFSVA